VFGCICGKGGDSTPAPPDPLTQQRAQVQALQEGIPKTAQLQYDVLANPEYGMEATTQLQEDVRRNIFPDETAVRDSLTGRVGGDIADPNAAINRQQGMLQNYLSGKQELYTDQTQLQDTLFNSVIQNLMSPSGATPEQQSAVDANRARAQGELVKSIRTRENLGGKLFGGGAASREGRLVGELQGGFAEADIARDEQNRQSALANAMGFFGQQQTGSEADINRISAQDLNVMSQAMPLLQLLYPQSGIQSPQYINPVVSPDTQFNAATTARGQDIQQQMAAQQAQAAQTSALFKALGGAAGGALSGGLSAGGAFT